jgi:hypothetical protein
MQGAIVSEFGDRKGGENFSGLSIKQVAIVDPGVNSGCQIWWIA